MITKRDLLKEANELGYKPENLEKVYKLLATLEQIVALPFLREKLVLKGGTALNLFHFSDIPRLSVDIDLNYIGSLERGQMLQERPIVYDAISQILQQNRFELQRNPGSHAGGKMVWRYPSALGQMGNLEIDLNFMYRQPLWPITWLASPLHINKNIKIPVLDIHELAAGKLSALFARQASRDLFDALYLLTKCDLNKSKLKLTFAVYLAMTDIDLANLNPSFINYDIRDMKNRLLPVLYQNELPRKQEDIKAWCERLVNDLRKDLIFLTSLSPEETDFIENVRVKGKIMPELLTVESSLIEAIHSHPALLWKISKIKS